MFVYMSCGWPYPWQKSRRGNRMPVMLIADRGEQKLTHTKIFRSDCVALLELFRNLVAHGDDGRGSEGETGE